jgi:hypothetical protein
LFVLTEWCQDYLYKIDCCLFHFSNIISKDLVYQFQLSLLLASKYLWLGFLFSFLKHNISLCHYILVQINLVAMAWLLRDNISLILQISVLSMNDFSTSKFLWHFFFLLFVPLHSFIIFYWLLVLINFLRWLLNYILFVLFLWFFFLWFLLCSNLFSNYFNDIWKIVIKVLCPLTKVSIFNYSSGYMDINLSNIVSPISGILK